MESLKKVWVWVVILALHVHRDRCRSLSELGWSRVLRYEEGVRRSRRLYLEQLREAGRATIRIAELRGEKVGWQEMRKMHEAERVRARDRRNREGYDPATRARIAEMEKRDRKS